MTVLQEELAQNICDNPDFRQDVSTLLRFRFASLNLESPDINETLDNFQVKRLAESALIMSSSPNDSHAKTAFELASLLVESQLKDFPGLNGVMKLVCTRLGNIPTIDLLDAASTALPLTLEVESKAADMASTISVGEKTLKLTRFQLKSFRQLSKGDSVSISAPTSAGKSFLITQYVANRLVEIDNYTAVVVVPTRALIRQLSNDFYGAFADYNLSISSQNRNRVDLVTSSIEDDKKQPASRKLFILTQERLQAVLYNWGIVPSFDLVVVDESQKISDAKRGIILEDTILELAASQKGTQFIFLSPLSSNPEYLLELLPTSRKIAIRSTVSPVAQHIYSVSTERGDRRRIFISKLNAGSGEFYTDIKTSISMPTAIPKRLAFVANILGKNYSNILYANGPSNAEKTALALVDEAYPPDVESPEVKETIDFISDVIHEEYYLVKCLRKGMAYHYGSMPDIARINVEDLFKNGLIRNVACTSTLLEGVNLPATNIFIDHPKLGRDPMDDSSFWNLAGRAGRLMKDFSGNVFCIYPNKWERPVSERKRYYKIKSSLSATLNNKNFDEYCRHESPQIDVESMEQAMNNLLLKYLERGEAATLNFLEKRVGETRSKELLPLFSTLSESIELPVSILKKNKGIDVRFQQHFVDELAKAQLDQLFLLIPRQPFSSESYDVLQGIFSNSERFFMHENRGSRYRYHTVIANKWIRENSLKEMIKDALDYEARNKKDPDVNKVIRALIGTLNDEIRYFYVRNTKCFCDLLKFELERRGINEEDYPPYVDFGLPNYLELGMSNLGTIQLHNLGLSRTAAIEVSKLCRRHGVEPLSAVDWVSDRLGEVASLVARPVRVELIRVFGF